MGVFATRSPHRPNPVGLSLVKLLEVKSDGLVVSGVDLVDGTPILDIKPYIQYSDAIVDAQSGYAQAEPERKSVIWSESAFTTQQYLLKNKKINVQYLDELEQVLALDPRPAYQEDPERVYKMKFSSFDINFKVTDNVITVVDMVEDISLV